MYSVFASVSGAGTSSTAGAFFFCLLDIVDSSCNVKHFDIKQFQACEHFAAVLSFSSVSEL